MDDDARYAIGDLAELADVSRRTVRYYVQEGLLPAPLGVGRGNHYGREHLDQLLKVKALQEKGNSLDEIRRVLGRIDGTGGIGGIGGNAPVAEEAPPIGPAPGRAVYRRLQLAPGVELHVAANVRLPSSAKLDELASWCRENLSLPAHRKGDSDD